MKKNVRILIVEDEFVTLDLLRDYLEEIGYEVSGDAMSADEAIQILEQGDTDIALLDINIKGDKDGIWLGGEIRKKYNIPFIYLTALSDPSSVEAASRTRPYGYLVKPFTQADIYTSIEVALNNYNEQKSESKTKELQQGADNELVINNAIFIKDNLVYKKIVVEDIMYVQAFKNYLELYIGQNRHVIRSTLSDFQKVLPKDRFVQTHRSYIINLNYLQNIGNDFVTISGISDVKVPISRSFKEDVMKHLKFYI